MADTTKASVLLIANELQQIQSDSIVIDTVENDTVYTVTINSNDYTYTSDGTALETEIIIGLTSAINNSGEPVTATATETNTKIVVVANSAGRAYTVAVDANMTTANIAEESVVLDDLWTLILADAALSISTDIVPAAYQEIIQRYLVAHKMIEAAGLTGSGSTGGPVKRERVGDVEREYGISSTDSSSSAMLALGSTKYGLEFMRLYKKYRYARFI